MLLRETDNRLNLLPRLRSASGCPRPSVREALGARVGIAVRLRAGPGLRGLESRATAAGSPLRVLVGKKDVEEGPLAGKSTLNRLELSDPTPSRYKKIALWKAAIDELLVKVFLESYATPPEVIILDVDVTHGDSKNIDHICRTKLKGVNGVTVETRRALHH